MERVFEQEYPMSELEDARDAALEAIQHYAHAAQYYIARQMRDFGDIQYATSEAAYVELARIQNTSPNTKIERDRKLSDAEKWAREEILRSLVGITSVIETQIYTHERLEELRKQEEARVSDIDNGYSRRRDKIASSMRIGGQQTGASFRETSEMLSDERIVGMSFDELEALVVERIQISSALISDRDSTLRATIRSEAESYRGLMSAKNADLDDSLEIFRENVRRKIREQIARQQEGSRTSDNTAGSKSDAGNGQKQAKREQPTLDPRIRRLMTETPSTQFASATVVGNIDHHRSKGKSDQEIYRLLARYFHPDRATNNTRGEEVFKVASSIYDTSTKTFII